MTSEPPAIRASDDEREDVVTQLREHSLAGRLTLEEFATRVEEAYGARTSAELEAVTRELPELPGADVRPRRTRKRLTFAAFGRFQRTGRWRAARRTVVVSLFGDVDLDLRQAQIEGQTTVSAWAFFGNVDVYVPEGVELDVGGFVLFGHRREWGRDLPPRPRTPLVRVRAFCLFGTFDVWRIPAGAKGSFRDLIRGVRSSQRELQST